MRWLIIVALLLSTQAFSQCKTYVIGVRHDTLNCTDYNNLKQGKWVINVAPKYGNPGYSEEGVFVDGKKEGTWRGYTTQGDIIAIEDYKWGVKNGKSSYYTLNGLEHEESWKATNPENPYDTIEVPDLKTDKVYLKLVKVEVSTQEHGTWTFYDPERGTITKQITFFLGQQVDPITNKPIGLKKTTTAYVDPGKVPVQLQRREPTDTTHTKPAAVKAWEKKNAGKKKVAVRDGATGG